VLEGPQALERVPVLEKAMARSVASRPAQPHLSRLPGNQPQGSMHPEDQR
jgi:hypothetical protein